MIPQAKDISYSYRDVFAASINSIWIHTNKAWFEISQVSILPTPKALINHIYNYIFSINQYFINSDNIMLNENYEIIEVKKMNYTGCTKK